MKRVMSLLLIAVWTAAGCDSLPRLWEQPKPPPRFEASKLPPAKPAVTADHVNDSNARAEADALSDEIRGDYSPETLTPRIK